MHLQDLSSYLEKLLQPQLFSDCCINGIQIEGEAPITRIATAVSASLATIEKAVENQVQALIVHHGIFWHGDSASIEGVKKKKIALLLEAGISLLCYHLPLDAHTLYGNNWGAAKLMGWKNLSPFGMYKGIPIGVKGTVPQIDREKFAAMLEKFYERKCQTAFGGKKMIESIALVSGGAYRSIIEAASQDIDAFITGSVEEYTWHDAFEGNINFYALGHSNTEKIGPKLLGQHLEETLGLPCRFIDIFNPF